MNWRKAKKLYKRKYGLRVRGSRHYNGSDRAIRVMERLSGYEPALLRTGWRACAADTEAFLSLKRLGGRPAS